MEYDTASMAYEGFVDLGSGFSTSTDELATEALVFMAVGLKGNSKQPIAYFLINGISAEVQKELVTHAIELLLECGISVVALTLDGSATNMSMLRKLGCSSRPDHIDSTISVADREVHCFLDPCHALKLVRNTFARLGVFTVPGLGTARWEHIARLHELQKAEGLTAANKLSDRHIKFQQQKMKVCLTSDFLTLYYTILVYGII